MTIFQASLHTRHFDFDAFGESKEAATSALIEGLRLHGVQYNLEIGWWMVGFEGAPTDEIFEYCDFEVGRAYRDKELM